MINLELLDNAIRYIEEHPAEFALYLTPTPDDPPDHVFGRYLHPGAVHVGQRAQRLLGVDWFTADKLFDPGNDLDDIKRIRDRIAAGGVS